MPSRNIVKIDVEDSYYHIYNRGVEKRIIFQDEQDHEVFLKNLKQALLLPQDPKETLKSFTLQGSTFKGIPRLPKNFQNKIDLLAYCLIPNHFHLLIKQIQKGSMKSFMNSISTRYSMYFNKKHKRVGPLFQGIYKAALVKKDDYILHLSRYIHLNPSEYTKDLEKAYSSYADYLKLRETSWLNVKTILAFFENANKNLFKTPMTYKNFVEQYEKDSGVILGNLTVED